MLYTNGIKLKGLIKHGPADEFGNVEKWTYASNLVVNGGLDALGKIILGSQTTAILIKFGLTNSAITQAMTALPGSLVTQLSATYTNSNSTADHSFTSFGFFKLDPSAVGVHFYTTGLFIGGLMFSGANIDVTMTSDPFYYVFEWKIICG